MNDTGFLKREVGVFGATMMGLGSMVGTGVFVSIGVAAGIVGPAVLAAIALAALVATCNALVACLSLAFFVEREIWMVGLGLIAVGLVWHAAARYLARRQA